MTQITGRSVRRATATPSRSRILFQRVAMCAIAIASGYTLLMKFSGSSLSSSLSQPLSQELSQPHSDPKPPLVAPTHATANVRKTNLKNTERAKHREEKLARWTKEKDKKKEKKHQKRHKGEPQHAKAEVKDGKDEVSGSFRGKEELLEKEAEIDDVEELEGDDIENPDERTYREIREEFEQALGDPNDIERLHHFVLDLRKTKHELLDSLKSQVPYDVNNCPKEPPALYPIEWSITDIIDNWNPNDTFLASNPDGEVRRGIYQSICRFDHSTEMDKILNYRKAEVPFLIRDDPDVLRVVERWNQPGYLSSILGHDTKYRVEYSETNSLMYFNLPKNRNKKPRRGRRDQRRQEEGQSGNKKGAPEGWKPPMQYLEMTYAEWEEVASQDEHDMGADMPHWYFRVNAKAPNPNSRFSSSSLPGNVIFKELPFFLPEENLYMVQPSDARGINCRFGMMG